VNLWKKGGKDKDQYFPGGDENRVDGEKQEI
jgi:hypothetical protein